MQPCLSKPDVSEGKTCFYCHDTTCFRINLSPAFFCQVDQWIAVQCVFLWMNAKDLKTRSLLLHTHSADSAGSSSYILANLTSICLLEKFGGELSWDDCFSFSFSGPPVVWGRGVFVNYHKESLTRHRLGLKRLRLGEESSAICYLSIS